MHLTTHELTMTVLMTPDMANFSGSVHGGTIPKFLDQVTQACACLYAGRYAGLSSMEIGIGVIAENIQSQELRHAKRSIPLDSRSCGARGSRCSSAH